jgi:hypothetical protein
VNSGSRVATGCVKIRLNARSLELICGIKFQPAGAERSHEG